MPLAERNAGLRQRRAVKAFEDDVFPVLVTEIREAAGSEIPVEVDWDQLYHQDASEQFWSDNFTKVYFWPVRDALRSITADELGSEALRVKLTGIRVTNTDNRYSDYVRFEDGTLVVDHCPMSNVDGHEERAKVIQAFLEDNL